MAKEPRPTGGVSEERMALGAGLGVGVGVVLSMLVDNWAMVGVGIALGVAFGAIPVAGGSAPRDSDDSADSD